MKTHRWSDIKRKRNELTFVLGSHNDEFYAKCNEFADFSAFGATAAEALDRLKEHVQYQLAKLASPKTFPAFKTLTVQLERDEDGYICVTCKELPAAVTFAETIPDALANAAEAIELCLESGDRPLCPADGEQWAWGERPVDGTPPSRDEAAQRFSTVEELMADLNADDES